MPCQRKDTYKFVFIIGFLSENHSGRINMSANKDVSIIKDDVNLFAIDYLHGKQEDIFYICNFEFIRNLKIKLEQIFKN